MAIHFMCPNGHTLMVDLEYAGKKVRCPLCETVVVAPHAAPMAIRIEEPLELHIVEEDYEVVEERPHRRRSDGREEDAPPRRRRRDDDEAGPKRRRIARKRVRVQQLRVVDMGLLLYWWKYVCIPIAAGAQMFALNVAIVSPGFSARHPVILLMLLAVVANLVGIMGPVLCCWVPPESKTRPLIILSLAFDVARLGCMGLSFLFPLALFATGLFPLVIITMGFCGLAAFILFMVFLRGLANYLGDEVTGKDAIATMVYLLVIVAGGAVVLSRITFLLAGLVGSRSHDAYERGLAFGKSPLGWLAMLLYLGWFWLIIKGILRMVHLIQALRARL